MKSALITQLLGCILILSSLGANAQDSLQRKNDSLAWRNPDSARVRRAARAALFSDSTKPTTSDYQLRIEKTHVTLNYLENESDLGLSFQQLKKKMDGNDSILAVLKENILNNSSALSLRNLQVFKTLLQNIQISLADNRHFLDSTESKLTGLKATMRTLMADTTLRSLYRDSVLRLQFRAQLASMREEWKTSTEVFKASLAEVDRLQTHVSSNTVTTNMLLEKVSGLYTTSGQKIFGKEYNYLWEGGADTLSHSVSLSFKKAYEGERSALIYYFKDKGYKRIFLLLIGLLFFTWVYRNVKALKKLKAYNEVKENNHFSFLPSHFILAAFVMALSLAPLFDLLAPSAYIEAMQFFLLIILTLISWKKWPGKLFGYWCAMFVLFVLFSLTHHIANPTLVQRFWLIGLNVLSITFGVLFLTKMRRHLPMNSFLRFVVVLHNVMNGLAIVANVCGRFSLAQILGNTAIFAFTHAIGLTLFYKICMEAFLMQIITSRKRNGVKAELNYRQAIMNFARPITLLVIVLWTIVFTINLNVYTILFNGLTSFLSATRQIGNASFTLSGVLLFFMIIWLAHLLQKYVGFFFGETGTDDVIPDKGQRSRLLVARLLLLCLGYLLAVAASGVPMDRITIVLGALGVGIGLGLQNIVNNFVSGIILIFDRPLQIGDIVEISNHKGRVREIGLRSSTLLTQEGAEIIVPNGEILSQHVVNWTLSNSHQRVELELNVNGSSDMELVASIIKKAIVTSDHIVEDREPQVLFTKVLQNGFHLKAFFWCKDVLKADVAKSEVLLRVNRSLEKQALQIG